MTSSNGPNNIDTLQPTSPPPFPYPYPESHDNPAYDYIGDGRPSPSVPPPSYEEVVGPSGVAKYPTATLEELQPGITGTWGIPPKGTNINGETSGDMDSQSNDSCDDTDCSNSNDRASPSAPPLTDL